MNKLIDILYKRQNYLIGLAVFLALSAVSITVGNGKTNLNFSNYPILMIFLVTLSIVLILIYIRIDNIRIEKLTNEIKDLATKKNDTFKKPVSELTSRQFEVYQLIASGKTNKEIMAELFIEQSTLKTHINHIYKKLDIKNRKELKLKATN